MSGPRLDARDRELLSGADGPAAALAMEILVALAQAVGAPHLIDVERAHIDSCLYHGRAGLDFARHLVEREARVRIPTTLNVSSLDLLHPDRFRGDAETARDARALMDAYVSMGCRPTWTCAPYQSADRPSFGQHIAWAESNAIVFANSVIGARTDRYGDFTDICAAITGRVPWAGLHRTECRRGQVLFDLSVVKPALLRSDVLYPVLGHLAGAECGADIPVFTGLPEGVDEDRLKALGAAAASSGAVAMFHAVGSTPEAATLDEALHNRPPERVVDVSMTSIRAARDDLSGVASTEPLGAISLGTPHFSTAEFERFARLIDGRAFSRAVDVWVSTSREVLDAIRANGTLRVCEDAGTRIVTDTCTYITPILRPRSGAVMTSSAKWAYYAPGNLGVEVVFGSLAECVESAVAGEVIRDTELWS
jgi:predicted aconitase